MKTAILLLLISLGLILWFPCPAATTNNPTLPISQLPDGNFPTALDRFVVNKWIPATTNFHTYTIDWAYIVGDDNNGMMPIVNNRAPTGWVSLVTGTLGTNATNFARASAAASTNYALLQGGYATNFAQSVFTNGTNYAWQLAASGSNNVLAVSNAYSTNLATTLLPLETKVDLTNKMNLVGLPYHSNATALTFTPASPLTTNSCQVFGSDYGGLIIYWTTNGTPLARSNVVTVNYSEPFPSNTIVLLTSASFDAVANLTYPVYAVASPTGFTVKVGTASAPPSGKTNAWFFEVRNLNSKSGSVVPPFSLFETGANPAAYDIKAKSLSLESGGSVNLDLAHAIAAAFTNGVIVSPINGASWGFDTNPASDTVGALTLTPYGSPTPLVTLDPSGSGNIYTMGNIHAGGDIAADGQFLGSGAGLTNLSTVGDLLLATNVFTYDPGSWTANENFVLNRFALWYYTQGTISWMLGQDGSGGGYWKLFSADRNQSLGVGGVGMGMGLINGNNNSPIVSCLGGSGPDADFFGRYNSSDSTPGLTTNFTASGITFDIRDGIITGISY